MEEKQKIKLFYKFVNRKSNRQEFDEFVDEFKDHKVPGTFDYLMDAYANTIHSELEVPEQKELKFEAQTILRKAKEKELRSNRFKQFLLHSPIVRIAAVILIVVSVALYWTYQNISKENTSDVVASVQSIEKSTAYGEISNVTMSDGTNVKLNAGTKITFDEQFTGNIREVNMSGQAFFDVSRNEEQPFVINAGKVNIRVLGTSFDVKAFEEENRAIITVVSGKVRVKTNEGKVILKADEQAIFDKSSGYLKMKKVKSDEFTKWMNGTLYFDKTPIKDVLAQMERWYDVEFKVNNKNILNKKVTGEYTNASLKTILKALEFSIDINYKIDEKLITIY